MNFRKNKRIYLDYAAATPVLDSVQKEVSRISEMSLGNPSGLHKESVLAKTILENSRKKVSDFFGVSERGVVFLSSATQSDNLAIQGSIKAWKKNNPNKTPHVITSVIEHPAVLEVIKSLDSCGDITVSYVGVTNEGVVDLKEFKESLTLDTALVTIHYVNSELGTVQPIKEIGKQIRHFKKFDLSDHSSTYPLFHTDASQSLGQFNTDLTKLPVDMLTASSQKVYGPKGVGVLVYKNSAKFEKIFFGGSQENNLWPGTQSVAYIHGFAQALEKVEETVDRERLLDIRNSFISELKSSGLPVIINGPKDDDLVAGHILNIEVEGFESEHLVLELDAKGFALSSRISCMSKIANGSHVLKEIKNKDFDDSQGSLRLSFGKNTKRSDAKRFVGALEEIFSKYKKLKSLR